MIRSQRAFYLSLVLFYCSNAHLVSECHIDKPKVAALKQMTTVSKLPSELICLKINNPELLTGYGFYQHVAFDPQIAINPKNPQNIVVVAEQGTLANAHYNSAIPLSSVVLYSFDGGETWNQANLVLSRCQGATNYKGNDNFLASYFPSVTFDKQGNCFVLSTSYNLFSVDERPEINIDEGNIVAKSVDGGMSWNAVGAAFRDDGSCHFLDYSQIKDDPFRKHTLYIVSSDNGCFVNSSCQDPDFTGNQSITFQKSIDTASSWSPVSIVASFLPDDLESCTPIPTFNQLEVLKDESKTLVISSLLQEHVPDALDTTPFDHLHIWRSEDSGASWNEYIVDDQIPHVLVVDPDSYDPILPITDFTTKDMTIDPHHEYLYLAYSHSQFNPTGQAGAVIRKSKDGGKTWSSARPINPKSLSSQTFLPTVAVARDGTVGILFYDLRNFTPGDDKLATDVWIAFFDKELNHYYGELRLTKESFDTRKSIRGYNGVDQANCYFDYYLSNHVSLKTDKNDFIATFTVTNDACPVAKIGTFPCDAYPLTTDTCNRQNVHFAHIKR